MRSRAALPLAAATVIGLVAVAPALAAKPALRMTARNPLAVSGTGFKAGEKVTVLAGRRGARVAVATSAGTFRVRFAPVKGACESLAVRATGSKGSRAILVVARPVACPPSPARPPTTPQPPADPAYPGA